MVEKLSDEIRKMLSPGFVDLPGSAPTDDRKECAYIGLRGATERLFMVLQYRSDSNYETAMQAVERAMAEYRATLSTPGPQSDG